MAERRPYFPKTGETIRQGYCLENFGNRVVGRSKKGGVMNPRKENAMVGPMASFETQLKADCSAHFPQSKSLSGVL